MEIEKRIIQTRVTNALAIFSGLKKKGDRFIFSDRASAKADSMDSK